MKTKTKVFKTSGQAQLVASIDDLLTEILLRLPIKSLIRFKSVSKHWNSLITDPQFCFLRNPNPNPAVGLFVHCFDSRSNSAYEYVPLLDIKSTHPPFRKSKLFNDPKKTIVLQSCNGLLLCYMFGDHIYDDKYFVYNPTTNQFSIIPKACRGCERSGMSLAFDPAKSPHYKLVYVQFLEVDNNYKGNHRYQFHIYSSEDLHWRECGEPFVNKFFLKNGEYWNGAVHWFGIDVGKASWIYFNVDDHILRVVPMPHDDVITGFGYYFHFWESCDHLHYIFINASQPKLLVVYEMRRDCSEWFVKYRVDLSPVVAAYPEMNFNSVCMFDIFSLVRGEKEEDSFLVLQIPKKAIRYNIVYQTFETIHKLAEYEVEDSLWFRHTKGFQYIESLCCV